MSRHVFTLNAGSSSIKFSFYQADGTLQALAVGLVEMLGANRHIVVRDGSSAVMHDATWEAAPGAGFHKDALQRVLAWRRASFPEANVRSPPATAWSTAACVTTLRAGDRVFRLPHPPRTRRHGRGAERAGRDGVLRRHRRARLADTRQRARRHGVDRDRTRPHRQPCQCAGDFVATVAGAGVHHPHRRGDDSFAIR